LFEKLVVCINFLIGFGEKYILWPKNMVKPSFLYKKNQINTLLAFQLGGVAMIIFIDSKNPEIKITKEDLDLSKKQQETLLALMAEARTASEIGKEKKMPLTTVTATLKELKEKEMIFSEKPKMKYETVSGIIVKRSKTDYWQLTKKGLLWTANVYEARGSKTPKEYLERLKKSFPKLASCIL
jgi:hypothetical protein